MSFKLLLSPFLLSASDVPPKHRITKNVIRSISVNNEGLLSVGTQKEIERPPHNPPPLPLPPPLPPPSPLPRDHKGGPNSISSEGDLQLKRFDGSTREPSTHSTCSRYTPAPPASPPSLSLPFLFLPSPRTDIALFPGGGRQPTVEPFRLFWIQGTERGSHLGPLSPLFPPPSPFFSLLSFFKDNRAANSTEMWRGTIAVPALPGCERRSTT